MKRIIIAALFLVVSVLPALACTVFLVTLPAYNATVSGTVTIQTNLPLPPTSTYWYSTLTVDQNSTGITDATHYGQLFWNSTTVPDGNHILTVQTHQQSAGTVTGSYALVVNVNNASVVPTHFYTLQPHAALPTTSQCSSWVKAAPIPEHAPWNVGYLNPPTSIPSYFYQYAGTTFNEFPNNADFQTVDGNFTGSTEDEMRFYGCKWGVDEDIIRAQSYAESHWTQTDTGDENNPPGCTVGLPITPITPNGIFCALEGLNGLTPPNQYDSFGIGQTKVYYAPFTYPMLLNSVPFALDYRYAEMRACMNGDEFTYFNSQSSAAGTDYTNAISLAVSNPTGVSPSNSTMTNLQYLTDGCVATHFYGDWEPGWSDPAGYLNNPGDGVLWLMNQNPLPWPGGLK